MRLLTAANLAWVVRHRAWTPYYLKRYWRFAWFKLRHRQVITEGFVFLGKHLEIVARPGHGRICLLYTSPSPRDLSTSRMPSSA